MAKEGGSPNSEEQAASPLGPGAESASPRGAGDSMADDIGAEVDIPVVASLGMSSEHAYSSVSKTGTSEYCWDINMLGVEASKLQCCD